MIEPLIKFFVMFFVVVEPISLVPMYAALTEGASSGYKRKMACKAVILAGLILVVFALIGGALLDSMGISIDAFRIFGGLMLFLIALDMVYVRHSGARYVCKRVTGVRYLKTRSSGMSKRRCCDHQFSFEL